MQNAMTRRCYFQDSKKYRKIRLVSRETRQETSSLQEACVPMGESPERSREKDRSRNNRAATIDLY